MDMVLKTKDGDQKKHWSAFEIILLVVLIIQNFTVLYLIFWGMSTSLKTQNDFRTNVLWLPSGNPLAWAWKNYVTVYKNFNLSVNISKGGMILTKEVTLVQQIIYSLLYAGGSTLIQTVVPCIVAYVSARFNNFKLCKFIYVTVIVVIIIPIIGSTPSEFQLLRNLRLYDTFWGNWIQKFHFLNFYYLVFFAAFKSLSKEYAEAAYMDGATEWKVMVKIYLPMARTIIACVALILFIGYWNDYQTPLLYLPSYPTLAYGIFTLSNSRIQTLNNEPMRLAGCMFLLVPILILFIAFKNKLMGNLSMGGIKE